MSILFCLISCLFLFSQRQCFAKITLDDVVKYYETLNYASLQKLYRRNVDEKKRTLFLDFDAYGRKFKLALLSDSQTIASDAEILDGEGNRIHFDESSLIYGHIVGEPGSIVHGILGEDGIFIGKIHSKDGVYFVESANRYFDIPLGFHSVIYKEEDVVYNVTFTEPLMVPSETVSNDLPWNRNRRSTGQISNNFCRLSLEADYTFLAFAKGAVLAVGEMLRHVQALNIIYGQTFNSTKTYFPYSIQFHVGHLRVYKKKQTPVSLREENIDSSTFLSMMSNKDYSKFCEAVYFTHRDFAGGILGLAWVGVPYGQAGGICDPRRGSKSYNTAIVTFTLQGKTSPPKVSEITFAHEIGHAFGAQHDGDECVPGGRDGNYIMFAKATSGDRKRNDRFSSCSIRQMMANVDAKRGRIIDRYAEKKPRLCFESYNRMVTRGDVCGNGVIDPGEECDCGNEDQCKELEVNSCCNWRTCELNHGCSPSQGPCCDSSCKTVYEKICEYGNDCLEDSYCPSLSERSLKKITDFKCPPTKHKPNGSECQGGALLCHNGLCSTSICTKYNLKPCECTDGKEECHACCIDNDGVCRSAYKIDKMKRSTPYNYSVGFPCAGNTGYCDFFQYCQKIDLEGPLLQLYNLYFTKEGIAELTRKYWWAIMLAVIALIAIIVLLVVFGARYTGTDNPDGAPAKPLPSFLSRALSFCGFSPDENDGRSRQLAEEPETQDQSV